MKGKSNQAFQNLNAGKFRRHDLGLSNYTYAPYDNGATILMTSSTGYNSYTADLTAMEELTGQLEFSEL